jgi:tRNA(fMet)-specific endonuclease VapC
MDLLIAAQAKSLAIPLVTNNLKEFKRILGLFLEDWV